VERDLKLGFNEEDIKKTENIATTLGRISEKFKNISDSNVFGRVSLSKTQLESFEKKLDVFLEKKAQLEKIKSIGLIKKEDLLSLNLITDKFKDVKTINSDVVSQLDDFISQLEKVEKNSEKVLKIHNKIHDQVEKTSKINQKSSENIPGVGKAFDHLQRFDKVIKYPAKRKEKIIFPTRNIPASAFSKIKSEDFRLMGKKKFGFSQSFMKEQAAKIKTVKEQVKLAKESKKVAINTEQVLNNTTKTSQVNYKNVEGLGKSLIKANIAAKVLRNVLLTVREVFFTIIPIAGLLAFAGIAAKMMELDKETKTLYRSLATIAGQSKDIFKLPHGEGFTKTMKTMNYSILDYAKKWGMTFSDASSEMESISGTGITLFELMGKAGKKAGSGFENLMLGNERYSMKLADKIKTMALFSGKSFSDMTNDVAAWQNEFGISLNRSLLLFTKLRKDANKTGLVTGRYFEKVMTAASGMIIYGTRLEDVSSLFADLANAMDLPREKAAELAAALMKGQNEFTYEQQVLIGQLGGAEAELKKQLVEYRKKRDAATGEERKILEKRIHDMEEVAAITDPMSKMARTFELLDPGRLFKVRLQDLMKVAADKFKGVSIMDTKELAKIIRLQKQNILLQGGQQRGWDMNALIGLADALDGLPDVASKIKDLSKSLGVNSKDLMDAIESQDPKAIADVLNKMNKNLTSKEIQKAFEKAGFDNLVKGIKTSSGKQEDLIKILSTKLATIKIGIDNLGNTKTDKQVVKEARNQADIAEDIAKSTTALEDVVSNQMLTAQYGILRGITGIWKSVKTIWNGLRNLPGIKNSFKEAEDLANKEMEAEQLQTAIENIEEKIRMVGKKRGDVQTDIDRFKKEQNKETTPEGKKYFQQIIDGLKRRGEKLQKEEKDLREEKNKKQSVLEPTQQVVEIKKEQQGKGLGQRFLEKITGKTAKIENNEALIELKKTFIQKGIKAGLSSDDAEKYAEEQKKYASLQINEAKSLNEELANYNKKIDEYHQATSKHNAKGGDTKKNAEKEKEAYQELKKLVNGLGFSLKPAIEVFRSKIKSNEELSEEQKKEILSEVSVKKLEQSFQKGQEKKFKPDFGAPQKDPLMFTWNENVKKLDVNVQNMVQAVKTQNGIEVKFKQKPSEEIKTQIENLIKSLGSKFKLVGLAQGGIVQPTSLGTLAKIAEGGQPEAVIPLDQLSAMIKPNLDMKNFQFSPKIEVKNVEQPKTKSIDDLTKTISYSLNKPIDFSPLTSTLQNVIPKPKEEKPLNLADSFQLFTQLPEFKMDTPQIPKIQVDLSKLDIATLAQPSQPQQNIVNENQTTNNNAPITHNYYNNVTIPVKNSDPNAIVAVVRKVLYERETTV